MVTKNIEVGEYTTIKVYTKTRDDIASEGKYNESMADIVERIFREWKDARGVQVSGAYSKK